MTMTMNTKIGLSGLRHNKTYKRLNRDSAVQRTVAADRSGKEGKYTDSQLYVR